MKTVRLKKCFCIVISILFVLLLSLSTFSLNTSFAEDKAVKRTVKVGYVDVPMFISKNGDSYSGYGVEYLNEICKAVNWNVEYVQATFSEQLDMLKNNEIDVVPLAQKTADRETDFIFSGHPMGNTQCVLVVPKDSEDYYFNDFSQFNEKKIAVQKGSVNVELLEKYAILNGFSYEKVECDTLDQALAKMQNKEVDIVAGSDQMIVSDNVRIVGCFGYEPYYFMLKKDNLSLMKELDYALDLIFASDSTYVHKLYDKYYSNSSINSTPTFTREEIELINKNKEQNKAITIALITDSQPDAYYNGNEKIVGIFPDILDKVAEMSGLKFKYEFSSGTKPPLEYIKENPNMLAGGVLITNPAFQKDDVVVSNKIYTGYSGLFVNSELVNIDVENKNYKIGIQPVFQAMNLYIKQNYPNLTIVNDYNTIEENLNALNKGEIDMVAYDVNMVLHYWGNPRYHNIRIASTAFMEEIQGIVGLNTPENQAYVNIINKCRALISQDEISIIERHHVSENFYVPTFSDVVYRLRIPLLLGSFLVVIIIGLMIFVIVSTKKSEGCIQQKNQQLTEAVQESERANRAKSEFLSCMSHDIRTPLNAILGMTEIAIANGNNVKKMGDCLRKINYSATHLTTLINDILDMSKIESGKMSLKTSEFSIVESMNSVVEMIRNMASEKKISLSVNTHNCKIERVIGDELKLNQVCLNLLTNAIKYTNAGGSVCFDFYEEDVQDKPNKVLIKMVVSDTGIGMSEEFQKTMYDSFERATDSRVNRIAGSGLGLFICKQFMQIMDGSIECKSKLGEGTTFTIFLELERGQQDCECKTPNKKAKEKVSLENMRLLVAEDNELNWEILNEILKINGIESDRAENGKLCLDMLNNDEQKKYSAILMDIRMPVMDGLEATRQIRSLDKEWAKSIPIIAMTADAFAEDVNNCYKAGMDAHLQKPIDFKRLISLLQKVKNNEKLGGGMV